MPSPCYTPVKQTLYITLVASISLLAGACKGEGADTAPEAPSTPEIAPQALSFSEGMGEITQSGVTGGDVNAESLGDGCFGLVGSSPAHRLTLENPLNLNIQVTALNNALEDNDSDGLPDPDPLLDTTLVITGPGGPYCNDDANGLNPSLSLTMEAGQFDIYVGTLVTEEEPVSYTLSVTLADEEEATVTPTERLPSNINTGRPPIPVPPSVGARPNIPIPRPMNIAAPRRDRGQPNIPAASPPSAEQDTTTE